MIRIFLFSIVVLLAIMATGTARAACPDNSSATYESGNVVHCKCNAGYEKRGDACKPIPTMNAMTRAQCLSFNEDLQSAGQSGCNWNMYHCMVERGSGFPAAWCAIGIVLGVPGGRVGVASGVAACGERIQAIYDACEPNLKSCKTSVAAAYSDGKATCPSN